MSMFRAVGDLHIGNCIECGVVIVVTKEDVQFDKSLCSACLPTEARESR